jgi:hypothetical protein
MSSPACLHLYLPETKEAEAGNEQDHPHHAGGTVGMRVTDKQKAIEFYVG